MFLTLKPDLSDKNISDIAGFISVIICVAFLLTGEFNEWWGMSDETAKALSMLYFGGAAFIFAPLYFKINKSVNFVDAIIIMIYPWFALAMFFYIILRTYKK